MDVDFTVLVNEAAREWYKGTRTIYFGSPKNGTLTEIFFTYTPRNGVWLEFYGAYLNAFVSGHVELNPDTFTEKRTYLMLQDGMISSGFKDIGPVRSHSKTIVDGCSDPAPWHGPKARCEAIALSYNSAIAIAHASAAGK
eukprot:1116486-Rhodomonas_salina.1